MSIETNLRQSLLPVFGFKSIAQIPEDSALVNDLGADSLDFVEIIYLVERDFGVVLKANELVLGDVSIHEDNLFIEGKLTEDGASILKQQFPGDNGKVQAGMTKMEIFQSITVRDLANIIRERMKSQNAIIS